MCTFLNSYKSVVMNFGTHTVVGLTYLLTFSHSNMLVKNFLFFFKGLFFSIFNVKMLSNSMMSYVKNVKGSICN